MKLSEMNAIVAEDLKYLGPRKAGIAQAILIADYSNRRKHYLKVEPEKPRGKVLQESIEEVRTLHPDAELVYDGDYFELES